IPASVATAVIPLTGLPTPLPTPPPSLNITVQAQRILAFGSQNIPVNNDYYNVLYQTDNPPSPDQFQNIQDTETALYIRLPPPPTSAAIPLTVPSNGTAPPFDDLYKAMNQALTNDASFPTGTTLDNLTANDCVRMAYDIVWSQQSNMLPPPPD